VACSNVWLWKMDTQKEWRNTSWRLWDERAEKASAGFLDSKVKNKWVLIAGVEEARVSEMQTFLQLSQAWTTNSKMKINYTKTKEMILGPLARQPPQPLSDGSGSEYVFIERVYHFKLLSINISHDMNWQAHIDAISHKATNRLHFLSILKTSGLKPHHLLHLYLTVIRPVLEYCSVVWHHCLTKAQSLTLEAIQRRALRTLKPTNHRHAIYLCAHSSEIAFSPRLPQT